MTYPSVWILLLCTIMSACEKACERDPIEHKYSTLHLKDMGSDSELKTRYLLSPWSPLDELPLSDTLPLKYSISQYQDLAVWDSWLRQFASSKREENSASTPVSRQILDKHHLFCESDHEGTYLMRRGDLSPALSFDQAPDSSDHLALFMFDLDSEEPQVKKSDPHQKDHALWENRKARLLWAVLGLDRNLRALPQSFGGEGLKLNGKAMPSTWGGTLQLVNDYSVHFFSPQLKGTYYGYDGPCIRWDDPLRHHRILILLFASPLPPSMNSKVIKETLASLPSTHRSLLSWRSFTEYILRDSNIDDPPHKSFGLSSTHPKSYWAYAIWQTP